MKDKIIIKIKRALHIFLLQLPNFTKHIMSVLHQMLMLNIPIINSPFEMCSNT